MSFMANKISSVFYAFPRNRRESNRKMEKSALLRSLDLLNLEERPSAWFTMFVTQVRKVRLGFSSVWDVLVSFPVVFSQFLLPLT